MISIPTELLFSVFERAYYKPDGFPDYDFLSACSLVCTSWSYPAQSLLFRCTTQLRSNNAPIFHAAINPHTARGRALGERVRSLHITVGRSMNDSYGPYEFAQLLKACPRLYELGLSTYGVHAFSEEVMDDLRKSGCGQSLRALNLMYCGVQSPIVYQLLTIWPSIQFLKIGTEISAAPPVIIHNNKDGDSNNGDVAQYGSRIRLYDLVLSRTLSAQVLSWLLYSSGSSLRVVDLRDMPGPDVKRVLAAHCTHLRSLRLWHFSNDSASLMRMCPRLEELFVFHIPTLVPLVGLPETIEHFSFRNPLHNYRTTLRPIVNAIRGLPRLRVLTCDANSEQLEEFVELRGICEQKGVDIRVETMPFWVHEDPVVIRRFPRRKSVSNFGLMA